MISSICCIRKLIYIRKPSDVMLLGYNSKIEIENLSYSCLRVLC